MTFGRYFTTDDGTPAPLSAWSLRERDNEQPLYTRTVPELLFHEGKDGWVDRVLEEMPSLRPANLYWTRDGELYETVVL